MRTKVDDPEVGVEEAEAGVEEPELEDATVLDPVVEDEELDAAPVALQLHVPVAVTLLGPMAVVVLNVPPSQYIF